MSKDGEEKMKNTQDEEEKKKREEEDKKTKEESDDGNYSDYFVSSLFCIAYYLTLGLLNPVKFVFYGFIIGWSKYGVFYIRMFKTNLPFHVHCCR